MAYLCSPPTKCRSSTIPSFSFRRRLKHTTLLTVDVTMMLDKMITAVDEELSEEDLMWIGDTLPPGVQHWERAFMFLGYHTVAGTALFPVALCASIGFSALTVVALVVSAPIYLSVTQGVQVRV